MTRFVQRDSAGRLVGEYAHAQPGIAEEEIADDDPELVAFRRAPEDKRFSHANHTAMLNRRLNAAVAEGDTAAAFAILMQLEGR